jgi:hypothetical protein
MAPCETSIKWLHWSVIITKKPKVLSNNLDLSILYIYSIDQKTSKEIKTDYGPDVDWVLRGSGSLSRGSAGAVNHHSLGIDGASGQIYGSNVSLQVIF